MTNSEKSLDYIRDYEARIGRAETSEADERFLRNFISVVAKECPLPLIIEMSKCILSARKAELKAAGEQN